MFQRQFFRIPLQILYLLSPNILQELYENNSLFLVDTWLEFLTILTFMYLFPPIQQRLESTDQISQSLSSAKFWFKSHSKKSNMRCGMETRNHFCSFASGRGVWSSTGVRLWNYCWVFSLDLYLMLERTEIIIFCHLFNVPIF